MEESLWNRYGAVLRAKEAELVSGLRHREGLATEAEPDPFDEIQNAVDRAMVVQVLDRSTALLRDVRGAIERLADGSYGRCLRCDEEIDPKRLAALPWAPLCLACQEDADRKGQERGGNFDFHLVNRAG